MHFLRVSLIVLTFCATVVPIRGEAEELHIQRYLDEPNTRVLVVEFYAKWCKPCMDAVPHWEKLRKKYWDQGLRLVVVKTQAKEPGCPNLKWQPDESICDLDSSIGDSLKVSALPSAFLWSWDGRLLVSDARHWKEVATQVKRFLARNPRVEVDARNARGKADRMLRKIVEAELSGQGKFSVVAGGKLEKRIQKMRRDSHKLDRREDQQCGSDGISANSLLKVEILGKRLAMTLWNEKGCQQKGVFAPWDKKRVEASVRTALHRLMAKLVKRPPQMPGGIKLRKQPAQPAVVRPATSLGGSSDWSPSSKTSSIVRFESSPAGAVVMLNGQMLCQSTPCSKSLTPGRYQVQMMKERYQSREETVKLDSLPLKWTLAPNFASLSVTSQPSGLTVTVDGKEVGTTPLTGHRVNAGEHTVMVANDCFVPTGKRASFVVGSTPKFSFTAPARPAGLAVSAHDSKGNDLKAQVTVDGKLVGNTPNTFKVSACAKKVVVKHNKHGNWSKALALKEKQTTTVVAKLGQLGGAAPAGSGWVKILPGSFLMGSPSSEEGRYKNETQHKVSITRAFYLQTTEVTQGQYQALMGKNPSHFSGCGTKCPVEKVSWFDALKYANALSKKEGFPECYTVSGETVTVKARGGNPLNCKGYRLPTEAEWEYAARAGSKGARYGPIDKVAWYRNNSNSKTHPVAQKRANQWGLYDMLGNVWEWTFDRYGTYPNGRVSNPIGAKSGFDRVFRGGGWFSNARFTRAANRIYIRSSIRSNDLGFRLSRSAL